MHRAVGIALIVGGSLVGLAFAFPLRRKAPAVVVAVVLALCGLALGAGALLVLQHVSATNWTITLVLMTILVPAHVRVVLGPFGVGGDEPRPTG
jgi:hypothetical protein